MAINIEGLVKNIRRTNIYTPIIEGIVNAIEAIEDKKEANGKITIEIYRDSQIPLDPNELADIVSIKIIDNGIGFDENNRQSFDTLYSDTKIEKGGKGFGRFTFLKYFKNVKYSSNYLDKGRSFNRVFEFGNNNEILFNEKRVEVDSTTETGTTLELTTIRDEHKHKIDKRISTVSRRVLEHLLIYFIDDAYKCPEITIIDVGSSEKIVLNSYIKSEGVITKIKEDQFELGNLEASEVFQCKLFKLYFATGQSSVILTADNREVTTTPLYKYIPEFKDGFYDEVEGSGNELVKKSYVIRAYVTSKFLNKHVSLERDAFNFPQKRDLYEEIGQEDIEKKAVYLTKGAFEEEVKLRKEIKINKIKTYIDTKAPWHKTYFKEINFDMVPFELTDKEIEIELQKAKFDIEIDTKAEINKMLENTEEFEEKVEAILTKITEIGKGDLVRYVATRRSVLDVFKKSLEINDSGKYDLEKVVHKIIFPLSQDSNSAGYASHNLWIIDEKLSFNEYLSSDMALPNDKVRPDILIFNNRVATRMDNNASNPLTIFEFKRPQRDEYDEDENPFDQIYKYVKKIRNGDFKTQAGRDIQINENTPVFGYLVCDLTPKIRNFAEQIMLTPSPDNKGYFGFHSNWKIYFEAISFDKLIEDASLRNKIFFKKLGIE